VARIVRRVAAARHRSTVDLTGCHWAGADATHTRRPGPTHVSARTAVGGRRGVHARAVADDVPSGTRAAGAPEAARTRSARVGARSAVSGIVREVRAGPWQPRTKRSARRTHLARAAHARCPGRTLISARSAVVRVGRHVGAESAANHPAWARARPADARGADGTEHAARSAVVRIRHPVHARGTAPRGARCAHAGRHRRRSSRLARRTGTADRATGAAIEAVVRGIDAHAVAEQRRGARATARA
jgi:hypothetical protein